MFNPITDLGKYFLDECQKLNDYFLEYEKRQVTPTQQEKASHAVHDFFKSITGLPDKVEKHDHSLSILFEIDQTLSGTYGTKVFSESNVIPMRKLLRDIMALWYRYNLLAYLERKNSAYLDILGIRSFYEDWISTEHVGIDESEYDRILGNVAMLLENNEKLEDRTRNLLFKMLGDILVTLGVSSHDSENSLLKYAQEIKDRSEMTLVAYAEVLLNLHVLHATNTPLNSLQNIDYLDLHKAIRYWSSTDPFSEELFKSWNVYWENDYFSALSQGDEVQLMNDKGSLLSIYNNPAMKIGVGQSFLEFMEHKKQSQGLTSIFKPIPIFPFGYSGCGKTAHLVSFCYDAQMRTGKGKGFGSTAITLGREFQSYYQANVEGWYNGSISPTNGYEKYSFWEDLNLNSYTVYDYEAKKDNQQSDDRDQQMNMEIMELFRNAKGLLFFLTESDYTNPAELRRKASQFDSFLQYWMQSNPNTKHIPVALVLAKADYVFGDQLSRLPRSSVIPPDFKPTSIDGFFPHRLTSPNVNELTTNYSRLRDCILNDKANNRLPVYQDIIQMLLDNFEQFFSRVLELTYNYQVFVTASVAPAGPDDKLFPFGAREPLSWVATVLERTYIRESIERYTTEEEDLNNKIRTTLEDVKKMKELSEEYHKWQEQVDELQESSNLLVVMTRKMKIEGYEKSKKSAEDKLKALIEKYGRKYDPNIDDTIKSIENDAKDLKNVVNALVERRKTYENRRETQRAAS